MQAQSFGKLVLVVGLVVVATLLPGCARRAETTSAADSEAIHVSVAPAVLARHAQTQAVAGVVRPRLRATIAAKVTGVISSSDLRVGREVVAGEVILTLQADELAARAEQAQAALAQAEREYNRERDMEKQGASTLDSVRTADDRRRQARAAAQEATAMLNYTRVVAPFDGAITEKWVEVGDLATAGLSLLRLEGEDDLRGEFGVPEGLPMPAVGESVSVAIDDRVVTGKLVEVSPAADPVARTRLAKVSLPADSGARSGHFVRAQWPAGEQTELTIPTNAVTILGQVERVYVVAKGRASLRIVRTAGMRDGSAIVSAGLDAGEIVVVDPSPALRDGQRVETTP